MRTKEKRTGKGKKNGRKTRVRWLHAGVREKRTGGGKGCALFRKDIVLPVHDDGFCRYGIHRLN